MESQISTKKAILAPMQASNLREHLNSLEVDHIGSIEVVPSLASTNDYLLQKKYLELSKTVVCVAEEQTQGRGRFGHQWQSPKGVNIYLSLLWPVAQWHQQYEKLGLLLLASMADMFEQLEIFNVQLKWPNDICVNEKKLGGILIDKKMLNSVHNLVVGIGINVAMSSLASVRIETPWVDLISIKPEWNTSRNELAAQIISVIVKTLFKLENNNHIDLSSIWSRYDLLYQRQIEFTYENQRKVGVALGIDDQGQIIIDLAGNLLHLHSSKVSDIAL